MPPMRPCRQYVRYQLSIHYVQLYDLMLNFFFRFFIMLILNKNGTKFVIVLAILQKTIFKKKNFRLSFFNTCVNYWRKSSTQRTPPIFLYLDTQDCIEYTLPRTGQFTFCLTFKPLIWAKPDAFSNLLLSIRNSKTDSLL